MEKAEYTQPDESGGVNESVNQPDGYLTEYVRRRWFVRKIAELGKMLKALPPERRKEFDKTIGCDFGPYWDAAHDDKME